jgi:hypothetical protein
MKNSFQLFRQILAILIFLATIFGSLAFIIFQAGWQEAFILLMALIATFILLMLCIYLAIPR